MTTPISRAKRRTDGAAGTGIPASGCPADAGGAGPDRHVSGPGASTLPMVVFSKVRLGVSPEINALATVLVVLVTTGIVIAGWSMQRRAAAQRPSPPRTAQSSGT